ncbi:hypothetical protein [Rummeliibacillus pycnus]|uniref:hypothetical protein n=1 Tax=Rummeliibacillus pycnus TaxID=101070 RepID=UPI001474D45B|nr:hypothetical protein [Rummeliibacillus pycnus]
MNKIDEKFEEIRKEINKLELDLRGIILNRLSIEYFAIDRRSEFDKKLEEQYLKDNM